MVEHAEFYIRGKRATISRKSALKIHLSGRKSMFYFFRELSGVLFEPFNYLFKGLCIISNNNYRTELNAGSPLYIPAVLLHLSPLSLFAIRVAFYE